ncbi:MAG: InlB B-repeat-containing protein [Clostridia bacterium]|nr:InlB B-repeat-containing protein [Clostridia bacterium]
MNTKKLLVVVLLALTMLALVGCGTTMKGNLSDDKVEVTFKGEGFDTFTMETFYGTALENPPTPEREGHIFTGWYLGGEKFDFSTPIREPISLSAHWTPEVYTVNFYDENDQLVASEQVAWGRMVTLPELAQKEGHNFEGWYAGENWFNPESLIKSSLDLKAVWSLKTCTVQFLLDGEVVGQKTTQWGNPISDPGEPPAIPVGHHFTGWVTAENELYNFDTPVKGDLQLSAGYAINVYTVVFLSGDGLELSRAQVEYGKLVTPPTAPEVDGFLFVKWASGEEGAEHDFTLPVTADLTIRAVYEEIIPPVYHTVRVFSEDGVLLGTFTVEEGKLFEQPTLAEGIVVTAWKLGDADYDFASPVMADLDITVVATYPTFTVTFVDEAGNVFGTVDVLYGQDALLPAAPAGQYFTMASTDELKDIKADKTIVLGVVRSSGFLQESIIPAKDLNLDECQAHRGSGNNLFLFADGDYLVFQKEVAGKVEIYMGVDARYIEANGVATFAAYMDGILVNTFTLTKSYWYTIADNVPLGEHTFKLVLLSNVNDVGEQSNSYGMNCTSMRFNTSKLDEVYHVVFKNADGTIIETKTVEYGLKVTAPEMPQEVDGAVFRGFFDAEGNLMNPDAYIFSDWEFTAHYEVITNFTVTFVDPEGNPIGEPVSVEKGGSVELPRSADSYYHVESIADLHNIQSSKTIVLTAVPKSDYQLVQFDLNTNAPAETLEKYNVSVIAAKNEPNKKNYGYILWQVGQGITFTYDGAGDLQWRYAVDRANTSVEVTVAVDGVVVAVINYATGSATLGNAWRDDGIACHLPEGEHTVTITLTDFEGDISKYGGFFISAFRIQEKKES